MRFVCESCRAQYMINDEKVGPKGVKVRCRKCGYVILVKRGDAAAPAAAAVPPGGKPGATLADPDDGQATQVMQNPLDPAMAAAALQAPGATMDEGSNPFADEKTQGAGGPNNLLGGVNEDEIGAVFDQVLNSGSHSIPKEAASGAQEAKTQAGAALGDDEDDRQSTRVLDAVTMQKLADETAGEGQGAKLDGEPKKEKDKSDEVPQTDWFVAIDEKQTGPMSLEKLKEHWDRGEVTPDSLCWRAGFPDWVPLSEVAQLTAVLAPRPSKPIVVAAPSSSAVVNVPVESAFSAGGISRSVTSQVPMPLASAPIEETGTWRPSAASALASLVQDEMNALAKPPPPRVADEAGVPAVSVKGLLDLPPADDKPAANGRTNGAHAPAAEPEPVMRTRPAPVYPDAGPSYSAPAISQYRAPESSSNKGLMFALIGAGALVFLVLVGLIIFLATRQPQVMVAPQVAAVTPPAAAPTPAAAPREVPKEAAPAAVAPGPAVAPAAAAPAAAAPPATAPAAAPVAAPPAAAAPAPAPGAVAMRPPPPRAPAPAMTGRPAPAAPAAREEPAAKPSKPAAEVKGDDFDNVFGSGKPEKTEKAAPAPEPKRGATVYVPPAPGGGGDLKESLSIADVQEVVLANKPAIAKCVEDQRKKEPGVKGTLLMKWTILTSGKVSNVSVQTEELKGSYMAGCVGPLIKGLSFPRHRTQGEPITFPFKF